MQEKSASYFFFIACLFNFAFVMMMKTDDGNNKTINRIILITVYVALHVCEFFNRKQGLTNIIMRRNL